MRNVLITGGAGGIGEAISRAFAAEGCRVFIGCNRGIERAETLAAEIGGHAIRFDVSKSGEAEAVLCETERKFGGIDVLVNNAGTAEIKMLCDTTDEDYNRIFGVNMLGVCNVTRAAIKSMVRKKYGKIINISSMWGICGASCEAIYSASKAAVIGFTKAMAKELAPSGINVNCIAPGVIDTSMNSALSGEELAVLIEETPLMRIGKPEDVAAAAVFLASDRASFITGQTLAVDGGITI